MVRCFRVDYMHPCTDYRPLKTIPEGGSHPLLLLLLWVRLIV